MAEFSIQCPHCGAELEVQDEWANMETSCPACCKTFIIPARPEMRPELKLRPQAGSVMANNFGNGQQTMPYYGPQTGGGSAPLAGCPSWREQTAAPPVHPFLRPFVNCLNTKGRASRLEFNLFMFITWPVLQLLFFLVLLLTIRMLPRGIIENDSSKWFLIPIIWIYYIFWTLPISVRRFHDFGYIGLHYLCQFIPIINFVYIVYGLYLIFRPSDPEENAFGPRP